MKQALIIEVTNQPGVLSRVAQVFSRRGFNIESLQVDPTETPGISIMTLSADGPEAMWPQIIKQTTKLIDVIQCKPR